MNTRPPTVAAGATRRGEPRTPTKQPHYVEKDSDQSDGGGVASKDSTDSPSGDVMIGRKIVKSVGETVCSGVVREFFPASGNEASTWKVEWDDGEETMAVVNRAELDKYLRMQMTKEAVFPGATAGKRGRGQPRAAASPKTPNTPARKLPTRKSPTPNKGRGRPRKSPSPSTRGAASGKKRSATPSRSSSATKKGKKTATPSKNGTPKKRVVLYGNKSDVDKLIAKEFEDGIYTGEVVKVKTGQTTLWNVRYEDGDGEDLNTAEMETCIKLYQLLLAKYNSAKGSSVPCASKDEDAEGKDEDDDAPEADEGVVKSPTTRGKGKAKKTTPAPEGEGMVGSRVRKVFELKKGDVEYDGTVTKFFPEESDDEHGDMWLVNYDDDDAEHFDLAEVSAGISLYKEHYALQKKEVDIPIAASAAGKGAKKVAEKSLKVTLYAEKPEGSRIFGTLDGYRESKKASP